MSATIRTVIANVSGERRVFFEIPAAGFGPDELDALEAAIEFARRQLCQCHLSDTRQELLFPEPCG
jgi:hypothetical protein